MKQIKTQLNKVLSKDMNRKEFLTYMGGALFLATGAGALTKNLADSAGPITASKFGSGSYGGSPAKPATNPQRKV